MFQPKQKTHTKTSIPTINENFGKFWIPPSKYTSGCDDERLGSFKILNNPIGVDVERKCFSFLNGFVKVSVQFTKFGKRGRAHPHSKVLVLHSLEWVSHFWIGLVQVLGGILIRIVIFPTFLSLGVDVNFFA